MIITPQSHLDHGLGEKVIVEILSRFASRDAFFIETFELPEGLGTVPCGLHGPLTGDAPVSDEECVLEARPGRDGPSRLCGRAPKQTRLVTVIGGPSGEACILYTAYGGPLAPREPWDPSIQNEPRLLAESTAFWREHALSR